MNLPTTIWVVYGTTGEHSDLQEWEVAAYVNQESAQAHADAANAWFKENSIEATRWRKGLKDKNAKNPFDAAMACDYTGTEWHIYPVKLHAEFKK